MDSERLKPILEAALLASPQPLTPVQLAELFDEAARPPADAIGNALEALAADCAERGVELVQVGSGFRYQIKTEVFPHITALWTERQSRYSRALLETLSLIAYRQPITRGEIEQIRGVAVATSILRTLEEREWVRVVGHRDVPGRPALYGTTKAFLDYFALSSLDELPPLSALSDLDNLEPELALEISAPATAAPVSSDPEPAANDDDGDANDGDGDGDNVDDNVTDDDSADEAHNVPGAPDPAADDAALDDPAPHDNDNDDDDETGRSDPAEPEPIVDDESSADETETPATDAEPDTDTETDPSRHDADLADPRPASQAEHEH